MGGNQDDTSGHRKLLLGIVCAYLSTNAAKISELPDLIKTVHHALKGLNPTAVPEILKPPIPIDQTITPDYLISLEDGQRYRTLRRHLSARDLTPHAYRVKWGLPDDYPMVAPNYSRRRAELAVSQRLGQSRWPAVKAPEPKRRRKLAGQAVLQSEDVSI